MSASSSESTPVSALSEIASGRDVKALVLVAHPDDETIGVGGQLWNWPSALVVHLTPGAPRDPSYARKAGFATPEDYAEARSRELDAALQVAALPASSRYQFEYTDQETCFHLRDIVRKLVGLIEQLEPGVIITHAYEGGHPDHDSAAFAAQAACRWVAPRAQRVPPVVEAPFYHHAQSSLAICEFLPFVGSMELEIELDASQRAAKQDMFDCFETQRQVLAPFPRGHERFRMAPAYDFEQPPHPGPLNYELLGWPLTGAAWREQARSALASLDLSRAAQSGSRLASLPNQ